MIQLFAYHGPDILGRYRRLIDEHQRLRGIALGQHDSGQQTEGTTANHSERQNPPVGPANSSRFGKRYLAIIDHNSAPSESPQQTTGTPHAPSDRRKKGSQFG